jgi:rod shape-determining protein MreC
MSRTQKRPLRVIGFALILLILPVALSETVRGQVALKLSPLFSTVQAMKATFFYDAKYREQERQIAYLREENFHLSQSPLDEDKDASLARVIFRAFASWNDFFWIDMGSKNSSIEEKSIVVSEGNVLIGLIDTVLDKGSRTRLVTSPDLSVSVHFIRRKERAEELLGLGTITGAMKGPLSFAGKKMEGFLFAFPILPKVKVGDLIVTSGLDGLFPKGLLIGRVISVKPTIEGDSEVKVIAESASNHIDGDISEVKVLSPVGGPFTAEPHH